MIINNPPYVDPSYILCITHWHSYRSKSLKGHSYNSDYVEIFPDGRILVKASERYPYLWNGPSPRLNLPGIGVVGTPRGPIENETGYRVTDIPSMYHDLLYEHLDEIKFTPSRKELDSLYFEMLGDYKFRHVHYAALRLFGALYKRFIVDRQHKFIRHSEWRGLLMLAG